MSREERDSLLMAYLDGQMSPTEAAAFDASLTEQEREFIAAELRLEAGLAERIQAGAKCPDAAWKRTQLLIRNESSKTSYRWTLPKVMVAAAAVLLVVLSPTYKHLIPPTPHLLDAPTGSLEAFAATSDVGADLELVSAFLAERGIGATFQDDHNPESPAAYHFTGLLGAREREYEGESVVEVLYNCCGFPAKIIMARHGSAAAEKILGWESMTIRSVRDTPGYVAGVISGHAAEDLMDLVHPTTG